MPPSPYRVPRLAMTDLFGLSRAEMESGNHDERVCRGTLVSRAQYLLDIGKYGYHDARLVPRGA